MLSRSLKTRGDVSTRGEDGDVIELFEDLSAGGLGTRGRKRRVDRDAEKLRLGVVSWTTSWGRLRPPPLTPGPTATVDRTRVPTGGTRSPGASVLLTGAGVKSGQTLHAPSRGLCQAGR